MPFDHEFVRSLLDSEETASYNEDLRERYGNAPVFDMVRELSIELSKMRLTGDELISTWNEHQELIKLLDVEAGKSGLMGQVVSLSGQGVEVPKLETDLSAAVAIISIGNGQELDERSLEKYYAQDEVRGIFSGFTLRFIKSEDGAYMPRVAYQVATTVVDIPHAHINLFSTGLAGISHLSFEDDVKHDKVAPILNRLFELCTESAPSLNAINIALASASAYDASCMRHVAYHAEKIVNATEDKEVVSHIEDGLVDLITHYVGDRETVHITTPFFSLSSENTTQETAYWYDESQYSLGGEIAGFVFLNQVNIKNSEVTYGARRALHIALHHEKGYLCTPLVKVDEFTIM